MQDQLILELCRSRLRIFLAQRFEAAGDGLMDSIRRAAEKLPEELALELSELGDDLSRTNADAAPALICDLVFRAGQMVGTLEALGRDRVGLQEAPVGSDGVADVPVEPAQLDALARFVETRDRVFRKVADFTLKALLVGMGLLVVGLVLGLI